jgi:hypothetical protein
MFPVIVLTNLIFFSAMVTELETSSAFAGAMLVPTKAKIAIAVRENTRPRRRG